MLLGSISFEPRTRIMMAMVSRYSRHPYCRDPSSPHTLLRPQAMIKKPYHVCWPKTNELSGADDNTKRRRDTENKYAQTWPLLLHQCTLLASACRVSAAVPPFLCVFVCVCVWAPVPATVILTDMRFLPESKSSGIIQVTYITCLGGYNNVCWWIS